MSLDGIFSWAGLFSLITLSILEIVLGIDNIIFIGIAVNKLPRKEHKRARIFGLSMAMIIRIIMLSFIGYLAHLSKALFYVGTWGISFRGLILASGGVFLVLKTWKEIISKIYHQHEDLQVTETKGLVSFRSVIIQIIIIDFVFSFDSILAAIGVSGNIPIMITAVVISMFMMMFFSGLVHDFIERHSGLKTVALSFLLFIGGILLAEGIADAYNFSVPPEKSIHINKNYAYASLAFALLIEIFNILERKEKRKKDLGK